MLQWVASWCVCLCVCMCVCVCACVCVCVCACVCGGVKILCSRTRIYVTVGDGLHVHVHSDYWCWSEQLDVLPCFITVLTSYTVDPQWQYLPCSSPSGQVIVCRLLRMFNTLFAVLTGCIVSTHNIYHTPLLPVSPWPLLPCGDTSNWRLQHAVAWLSQLLVQLPSWPTCVAMSVLFNSEQTELAVEDNTEQNVMGEKKRYGMHAWCNLSVFSGRWLISLNSEVQICNLMHLISREF